MKFQDPKFVAFYQKLHAFIPSDRLFTDPMKTLAWGADASFYHQTPQIVVFPENEDEISRLLKIADENSISVTFRASGTSLSGQASTTSVLVVVGQKWEQYQVLENGRRIRLQPGVLGGRVNQILGKYGYKFPPDPASINAARVGGIVANNASGMNCGVHANSERVMESARIVFANGDVLDVGDEISKKDFLAKRPEFVKGIEKLRDEVRSDPELVELLERKYRIKNVTGLNIRPLIAYDDPFEIISRLIVGSEGTLAFLSEITTRNEKIPRRCASAMLYVNSLYDACRAVQILKKQPVVSAEILDRVALRSVENAEGTPEFVKTLGDDAASILLETKSDSEEELAAQIQQITASLEGFPLLFPIEFTEDSKIYSAWWAMRSGVFPTVGALREPGSTSLIEDVAFPLESLPDATVELQKIIAKHGYTDGVIYGHALEGNFHFVLNQRFDSKEQVERYRNLMEDVVSLVVDKYHGSLKAEHGTGRNMAPFVEREWGAKAFEIMRRIKKLYDPNNILNPGVIFNPDPECYIKDFKELTKTNPLVDKCIECGFCEPNCLTYGHALSSRQRIVIRREIARLQNSGANRRLLKELLDAYRIPGEETCAGDGLCSTSCPMGINVGDLTHVLREEKAPTGSLVWNIGDFSARRLSLMKAALRPVLSLARLGRAVLGSKGTTLIGKILHSCGLPLWTPSLPRAYKINPKKFPNASFIPVEELIATAKTLQTSQTSSSDVPKVVNKVVYLPSCINQTMGASEGEEPLVDVMVRLLEKSGYEVVFPPQYENLCCGTIWESKGMPYIAEKKIRELEKALQIASNNGEYPILCDQSPCLYRMRCNIASLKLYEPIEFIETYLVDKLDFHPIDEQIAIHSTCSTRKLKLHSLFVQLAKRCVSEVLVPEEVGCCGFAGDKGFTHPEVNAFALRKLRPQIEENGVVEGFSTSRTCEIGLATNSGVPYKSIVYLVDRCTTPKSQSR